MKKIILRVLIVGLIVIGAFLAVRHFHPENGKSALSEPTYYGNVDIREVSLAFNASERIEEIAAEEGDRVEKGQVLARLRNDLFKLAVLRSEARVGAQREIVRELVAGTREEEIQKARAETEAAKEKSANATRTCKRLESLAEKNLAARQDADDACAAADMAKAQLKAAVETLNLALAGPREERIAAEKQKLKGYQAELEIVRKNLEDAVLYAPSDGVIRNRILQVGDMAFPQRPVLTLALTDPVWVRAFVPETDLGKIYEGKRAEVKTDSHPEKYYEGWVGYISPTAEFTPKTVQTPEVRTQLVYQVRVFVKNPENELRLGMPATVVIPLEPNRLPKKPDKSPRGSEPDERH